MESNTDTVTQFPSSFSSLALPEPILRAVSDAGYNAPTPIQGMTIPVLLTDDDLIAQAQTGTGKTAAFALPLLARIDVDDRRPQVLVLAPTRELANQVADGFATYGKHLSGVHALPVYGGSDYDNQLRGLRRGAQIVVGTPGRVMDHIRRGTLQLDALKTLVLDEADEMLRMGFIEDVEWILDRLPEQRQIALFSATMPRPIRAIAQKHLKQPQEILIESRTAAAESIRQRYIVIPGNQKADALIRILEMEDHDGVMVFVKTKTSTVDVADRLRAHGLAACALNGDLSQNLRERTVAKLKKGDLNIIVATDVAARGLDVDRISHVVNFDVPNDAETYVHRIGRTGRAGKSGEAILFLTPRDKRILNAIEKTTRQPITGMNVPSIKAINQKRIEKFNAKITETLETADTSFFQDLIQNYFLSNDVDPMAVSAAIAHILQGDTPILLPEKRSGRMGNLQFEEEAPKGRRGRRERESRNSRMNTTPRGSRRHDDAMAPQAKPHFVPASLEMQTFRVEVGEKHGVTPSNIVGAIANEANIASQAIGRIQVTESFSYVELPKSTPRPLWRSLKKVWVCNREMNISKVAAEKSPFGSSSKSKPKRSGDRKRKRAA